MDKIIRIAAALILREDGCALLVRKTGSSIFMQPGGKIEPGEQPVAALLRELHEELGLVVSAERALPLGHFAAPTANEPGYRVEADIFLVMGAFDAAPAAEIAETRWVDPDAPGDLPIAQLSRAHILTLARSPQVLLARRAWFPAAT